MTRTRKALVTVAALAMATSIASPAAAERDSFKDDRGDLRSGYDLRSVRVKNGGDWITVKSKHRNLRRGPEGLATAYIDTVRDWRGPEFQISGAVGAAGGYGLTKVRQWHALVPPVKCSGLRFRINYRTDVVTFSVKRRCLARVYGHRVRRIRVAAMATRPDGRRDYAPRRHRLYGAVAYN